MNTEKKTLSIVLPTYNRANYLALTLDAFVQQLNNHKGDVSFTICNNASTDDTLNVLKAYKEKWSFFDYINFEEHVSIGYSLSRAVDQADGEYVLLWGDDDLPAPFMISALLETIHQNPGVSLIHFNRLVGLDNDVTMINKLTVINNNIGWGVSHYDNTNDFLNKYVLDMTFMSSFVFKKDCWGDADTEKHYGYEFLGKILYEVGRKKPVNIVYIQYPLCIQRKPFNRPWMNKSPYYRFVGIPNMYEDFEKWGLIDSARDLWMNKGNTKRDFLAIMWQTSVFKKEYRPIFKEMIRHQYSFGRKALTFFFIYISPAWLYKSSRKIFFRK